MQIYIDSMIDAGKKPLFDAYIKEAREMLKDGLFEMTDLEGSEDAVIASLDKISKNISPSVTVSTMHGCPPKEIEAISAKLLKEDPILALQYSVTEGYPLLRNKLKMPLNVLNTFCS